MRSLESGRDEKAQKAIQTEQVGPFGSPSDVFVLPNGAALSCFNEACFMATSQTHVNREGNCYAND